MLRATDVIAKGDWHAMPVECVVLGFEQRHRNAISFTTVSGKALKLDLAEPTALRSGDALELESGELVEIIGQPEPLAEMRAESPQALAQIAWNLGNRHYQCEFSGERIRFRRDPMLEAIVVAMGGKLRFIEAAFDPEGPSYARHKRPKHGHGGHAHANDANCGCGHDHHHHAHGAHDPAHAGHSHADHTHPPENKAKHAHVHDGDCWGGHHHGHKHD